MKNTILKKLYLTILFSILITFFIPMGFNIAQVLASTTQHTFTINNNCTNDIWVGSFTDSGTINTVTNNNQPVSTTGGWKMVTNTTATIVVSSGWSGRFWPRTGCSFKNDGTCPAAGAGDNPPADCCDTGGCKINSKDFGLDCTLTGNPPATLAEFTVTNGGQDNYDVSMVDGGNIPVDIIPDSSTYDCSSNTSCIFTNNLPGKNSPECTADSDCESIFGPNSTASWKCEIDKKDATKSRCVNPLFCGSPGCSDTNGCAPVGLTQSLLPPSSWGGGSSELAIAKTSCPAGTQFTDTRGRGDDYVGCIAPQKFCRISCSSDEDCPSPFKCGTDFVGETAAYCGTCTMPGTGMMCDNFEVWGNDCDSAVGSTTKEDLWACTGTNSGSCFTAGAGTTCCGCPSWAPGFPTGSMPSFPAGACENNNTNWKTNAEPIAAVFNIASPTSYSFAFDDFIKLFTCQSTSGGSLTNYTINLCCINNDGDSQCNSDDMDADNDGITNSEESFVTIQAAKSLTTQQNLNLNDPDGDGINNNFDLDSDGDGIPDHFECNGENDADQDGISDNFTDLDTDGHHDLHDESVGGEALNCVDTDGDGTPDFVDHDSDNDGFTDAEEAGGIDKNLDGVHDNTEDSNSDGLADELDPETGSPLPIPDTTGDGTPDFRDSGTQISNSSNCSLAGAGARPVSDLVILLIPAFIFFRRFLARDKS
ncbi:MAG: thaumatin family protein [Thermodesulfobacteriota bacterium]